MFQLSNFYSKQFTIIFRRSEDDFNQKESPPYLTKLPNSNIKTPIVVTDKMWKAINGRVLAVSFGITKKLALIANKTVIRSKINFKEITVSIGFEKWNQFENPIPNW